jgi:nucleoside-diphosphate-sugar epimerase
VHSLDAGEAFRLAVTRDVRGAFNVAAEPVLDPEGLGRLLEARPLKLPVAGVRAATFASWKLRLQPTPPGWLDLALSVPLMDTSRARNELGWEPRHTSGEALLDLLEGMREGAGLPTPPLDPGGSGPLRVRELVGTRVGGRST